MKHLIITSIACLLASAFNCGAEETSNSNKKSGQPISIPIPINQRKRTRDVPVDNVEAEIRDGYLFVRFLESEGSATVTMSEPGNGTIYRAGAQTAAPIVVPAIESEMPVQVVIRTADSNEYEGWIFASPAD